MTNVVLKVDRVGKTYGEGAAAVPVLRDVSMTLYAGQTGAIVGPSGSGKTTLLSLCAGLDKPSEGQITLLGHDIAGLTEADLAALRCRQLGFIFQSFHLMASLTALENVMLPLELAGGAAQPLALELLEQVGLAERVNHYPAQLSGGEQQRVAVARAFINQPKILFADEPTGNLDRSTSDRITELIFDMNLKHGTTLLLITHDEELAARTARCFDLRGGGMSEREGANETMDSLAAQAGVSS